MKPIRLQKYLAQCGIASRRKAELLILQGRVQINETKVATIGVSVQPSDKVYVDHKQVVYEEKVYILLHKPIGYISSRYDPQGRKTVLDLLPEIPQRVYPVGRLDYDTSGLLLMTNDGEFSNTIMHPSHHIEKTYIVKVLGNPSKHQLKHLESGIVIEGKKTSPAKVKRISFKNNESYVQVVIHEGRNRQVRKMFDAIGCPVLELQRVAIGNIQLTSLPSGVYRFLDEEEVQMLRKQANSKGHL